MADLDELAKQLVIAQAQLRDATAALAPKHKGGEWDAFRAARQDVLALERALAAACGDEHAVPLAFPVEWDTGAPLPHLMVGEGRALLAFVMREPDPSWDGTYVTIKRAAAETIEPLALVEFERCVSAKLGAPNDEVFAGHPLAGKGLEGYTAQEVVHSRWLAELEQTNRVHTGYRPEAWRERHHFVLWFHDSTFECVARGFRVETHRTSVPALLAHMAQRLVAR